MKLHKIGTSQLEVSPINLGGNVFGWTLDEAQSFRILDAFVEAGYNFIDTADTYPWWLNGTGGLSESIIGKWLKARNNRDKVVIATKVGSQTKEHPNDISPQHIAKSLDESLTRLQTDYIDLYYTHFDDEKTPVADTLAAYKKGIDAGKIRYIGASNVSPERLKESFQVAKDEGLPAYIALQPHYNLLEREAYETNYAPLAAQYGLSVFPYWALASGFLSGKYRSKDDLGKSVRGGSVEKYLDGNGPKVLAALDQVSKKHSTTPAAVSLAWLLSRPNVGAPISSATKDEHLKTMFAAAELTLDAEDVSVLDEASRV